MSRPLISPTPRELTKRIASPTMRHSSHRRRMRLPLETNLRRATFETGLGSLSGDQASSEWEERQKSRADELVTIHDTVNLETELDCMKGTLAETENSLADEASSEWEKELRGADPTNWEADCC